MGIDVASLGKGANAALTPLQAHSRYLPIGGKNTKCRCKTDCSKSTTCSCRKGENCAPNTATRIILSAHGAIRNSDNYYGIFVQQKNITYSR